MINLVCTSDIDAVQVYNELGFVDSFSLFDAFYYPRNADNEGFWVSEQSGFIPFRVGLSRKSIDGRTDNESMCSLIHFYKLCGCKFDQRGLKSDYSWNQE